MTARIDPSVRARREWGQNAPTQQDGVGGEKFAPPTTADELAVAKAELAKARADVDNIRKLVSARRVGASALHTAEYMLAAALKRMDHLGWHPPIDPGTSNPEPDWDDAA